MRIIQRNTALLFVFADAIEQEKAHSLVDGLALYNALQGAGILQTKGTCFRRCL